MNGGPHDRAQQRLVRVGIGLQPGGLLELADRGIGAGAIDAVDGAVEEAAARQLALNVGHDLNAAAPGGNPDPPASACTQDRPVIPDAMILVRGATSTATVWATFTTCHGRGLDNGTRQAQLTLTLVYEITSRLGFTMRTELPQ